MLWIGDGVPLIFVEMIFKNYRKEMSGKSHWIFEYKIVFRVSIFIGYLDRFHPIAAFSWNIFLLWNLDGIHFYESIVVHLVRHSRMLLAFASSTAIGQDEKPKETEEQKKRREATESFHVNATHCLFLHFTSVCPLIFLTSAFLYFIYSSVLSESWWLVLTCRSRLVSIKIFPLSRLA